MSAFLSVMLKADRLESTDSVEKVAVEVVVLI
jgi:hypothetical protein